MIRDVIAQVARLAQQEGFRGVFCRLVETRGSTPQKAGACMLVTPQGKQIGTLGGGCVEAEVKRRALGLSPDASPELITFNLDNDYGWDDGLICGGRMTVLLDPLSQPQAREYLRQLAHHLSRGDGSTEAVLLPGAQLPGLVPGDRLLLDQEGRVIASTAEQLPAEAVEQVVQGLRPLDRRVRPYTTGKVAYLPQPARCRLVIVGAGHVGQAVARLAVDLDFEVWVMDDREDLLSKERFPGVHRRLCGPFGELLPQLEVDQRTYCLIVTRGHNHDEEALFHLIQKPARYIGMIGSRRKIRLIFEDLASQGIPRERLEEVYAPVGIDIGSQTVMEIAISILAELVAHRNRDGCVPGRPQRVSALESC